MTKYETRFSPEGTRIARIKDDGISTCEYFTGYDFMGSANWSTNGADASLMELDEAESIMEDLIASDDDIMPDYAKAYQEMIKQGESLEDLNRANHFALENGLITLEEFLKAARVLALQIINR